MSPPLLNLPYRTFFSLAVAVLCAVAMAACATKPGTGTHAHGLERNGALLGRSTGWEDAMAGLSQDPGRHRERLHRRADEDDFEEEYLESYRAAATALEERRAQEEARNPPSHSHGYRDDPDQAFDAGKEAGRRDRARGLSRDAYRHAGARQGPASAAKAWILGYGDGWGRN
jgi:hypothetical protein